ncbi:MAG TPA: hypothetical protein VFA12_20230 [Stellaceae bacterium]|nr:hypothetical protein [Stellaceae bacterium]
MPRDYTALKTAWNSSTQPPSGVTGTALIGSMTNQQKADAINGWVVAGSKVDVPIGSVIAYLALQGKLTGLQTYVAGTGQQPQSLVAAKELLTLLSTPSITSFQMSNPATGTAVENFLNALAADSASGIVAADVTALLAMADTTVLWRVANGYADPITIMDLEAAGLIPLGTYGA